MAVTTTDATTTTIAVSTTEAPTTNDGASNDTTTLSAEELTQVEYDAECRINQSSMEGCV